MNVPLQLVHRIERLEFLDKIAKPVSGLVGKLVAPRAVRNTLSGTAIGHPLHPMLTDIPIGAWSMAALLDAVGGPAAESAADLLVATGVLAAVPTAASGLNDWSDTYGPTTRTGLVHAAANVAALSVYVVSLISRARGHRGRGRALGYAGAGLMMAGGYLGGHLSYVNGVNVNHTAFDDQAEEWTSVLGDGELQEGRPRLVDAGGTGVLLVRDGGVVYALADTCTHAGGPLHEGEVAGGCVTCPWHASTFRLADGSVARGPASVAQPVYDTRNHDGQIQVRVRAN